MSRYKALLIDDQPETMLMMKHALDLKAVEWKFAKSAAEATASLYVTRPDLIVLDLNLGPHSNGLDWLMRIRKEGFEDIPVIIMTSSNHKEDVVAAIERGVDDYIVKPADYQTLTKKIFNILRKIHKPA